MYEVSIPYSMMHKINQITNTPEIDSCSLMCQPLLHLTIDSYYSILQPTTSQILCSSTCDSWCLQGLSLNIHKSLSTN